MKCEHVCLTHSSGASCSCDRGFSLSGRDQKCQPDIDATEFVDRSHPAGSGFRCEEGGCKHNGSCVFVNHVWSCLCHPGYGGPLCDIHLVSASNNTHHTSTWIFSFIALVLFVGIIALVVKYFRDDSTRWDGLRGSFNKPRNWIKDIPIVYANPIFGHTGRDGDGRRIIDDVEDENYHRSLDYGLSIDGLGTDGHSGLRTDGHSGLRTDGHSGLNSGLRSEYSPGTIGGDSDLRTVSGQVSRFGAVTSFSNPVFDKDIGRVNSNVSMLDTDIEFSANGASGDDRYNSDDDLNVLEIR